MTKYYLKMDNIMKNMFVVALNDELQAQSEQDECLEETKALLKKVSEYDLAQKRLQITAGEQRQIRKALNRLRSKYLAAGRYSDGMVIYSREKVARLREQYPAGTRICLNSMDGEAGMPQGLEGTVQYVDDAGQLGVKWDNGRSLSLIPGVDSFHKKEGQGHPEEKPRKKRESDLQR